MKKILAMLLALAMLLPVIAGIPAVSAEEAVEAKPFYMVNWNGHEADDIDNVYYMTYFWGNAGTVTDGRLSVKVGDTFSVTEIAQNLKDDFDNRPEGTRYINFMPPQGIFPEKAKDVIDLSEGFELMQAWLDKFLAEYQRIGGKIDGICTDMEYFDCLWYWLQTWYYNKDEEYKYIYYEIVSNPVYTEKIRPQLEERGFKFYDYESQTKETPEIYCLYSGTGDAYSESRRIWDVVMRNHLNQYLTDYIYGTLIKYFPDAEMNDYQAKSSYGWMKESERDGSPIYLGGNYTHAGSSSNSNFYAHRPNGTYFANYQNQPAGYNNAYYEDKVFNHLLFDYNHFKNAYLAGNGDFSAWTAYYDYGYGDVDVQGGESASNSISNTPYYSEMLFHINMLDPEPFIGFIVPSPDGTQNGMYAGTGEVYHQKLRVVDQILDELTKVAGYSDRKPITVPSTWNDSFVISGMYANGRNIWRITPDTSLVSVEDFKVEGTDPTFSVNGKTITFPGGKIIEDGQIAEVGTCGYWVETDKDTTPVVTQGANYYSEHPAYTATFDDFEAGSEFNYYTAKPDKVWEFKRNSKGGAMIVADPENAENNVLALSKNVTLWNIELPKYITAGDSYAKQQAWEITFTAPANMPAEGEVVLLNYSKDDGGVMIKEGKLWYWQNEQYVAFEGIDLSAGGKYTIRREMDFRTEGAYTCSYYILSKDGSVAAKAENVALTDDIKKLPLEKVGISCLKLTDAVLLDDYKLYATGVAADFEIYDANTGILVAEPQYLRSTDTAYRLSWMNASQKAAAVAVVAAHFTSDNQLISEEVIKTLDMKPGTDGIETGIVKVGADGQYVYVYLRELEEGEVLVPQPAETGLTTIQIVLIAAIAVVLVLLAVAVVLLTRKPKAAKAEEEAAPAAEEIPAAEEAAEAEEAPAAEDNAEDAE